MKLTIATLISFVAMVLAMVHPFFLSRHAVVNPVHPQPTEFSGQKRDIFERGSMATCVSCAGLGPALINGFAELRGIPDSELYPRLPRELW
jgi:hypothetical protein